MQSLWQELQPFPVWLPPLILSICCGREKTRRWWKGICWHAQTDSIRTCGRGPDGGAASPSLQHGRGRDVPGVFPPSVTSRDVVMISQSGFEKFDPLSEATNGSPFHGGQRPCSRCQSELLHREKMSPVVKSRLSLENGCFDSCVDFVVLARQMTTCFGSHKACTNPRFLWKWFGNRGPKNKKMKDHRSRQTETKTMFFFLACSREARGGSGSSLSVSASVGVESDVHCGMLCMCCVWFFVSPPFAILGGGCAMGVGAGVCLLWH